MKNFAFLLSLCLILPFSSKAQVDHTLYGFRTLPQVTMTNPAHIPLSKINFTMIPGLSSASVAFNNSGFTYSNLVDESIESTVENLRERNFVDFKLDNEWLHFGMKIAKKNYLHLSISERARAQIQYPKDLITLLWEGNGRSLLGQTADLSNMAVNLMHYREYAVGFAREVTDELTLGARAKYLNGFSTFYTRRSQFGLNTDSTSFDLTMTGNFEVNSAGLPLSGDSTFTYNPLFTNNSGVAFDLGLAYRSKTGFGFSLSALNLGSITWRDKTESYTNEDISFVYRGIPINNIFVTDDSTAASAVEELRDTLLSEFNTEVDNQSFSTVMPAQLFLGFSQQLLNERLLISLVGNGVIQNGYFRGGARLGATVTVGKILGLTANYGVYGNSPFNLGFGFSVTPGPVQFYMLTDNVIGLPLWDKHKNVHVRFGFNITIGKQYGKSFLKVRA